MKMRIVLVAGICAAFLSVLLYRVQPALAESPSDVLSSIETKWLRCLSSDQAPVSIYLVNGIKLQGQLSDFDGTVVVLKNSVEQVVYKHAISTIVPSSVPSSC